MTAPQGLLKPAKTWPLVVGTMLIYLAVSQILQVLGITGSKDESHTQFKLTRTQKIQRDVDGCVGVLRMNLANQYATASGSTDGMKPFEADAYGTAYSVLRPPMLGSADDYYNWLKGVNLAHYCRFARTGI